MKFEKWMAYPLKQGGYTRHLVDDQGETACGKRLEGRGLIAGDETKACAVCVGRARFLGVVRAWVSAGGAR